MVFGPVGPFISMISSTRSLIGCYTVCTERGEKGQARHAGDRVQIKTGQ